MTQEWRQRESRGGGSLVRQYAATARSRSRAPLSKNSRQNFTKRVAKEKRLSYRAVFLRGLIGARRNRLFGHGAFLAILQEANL